MHLVQRLGYLSIGVADLDAAIDFYARYVRLDLTERVGTTAFMTGGVEHHWIRLEEGERTGVNRVGYEVADEATLAEIAERLRRSDPGIEYTEGGDFGKERVHRWLRFEDPSGFPLELFVGMAERPVPPVSSGVALDRLLHAGWKARDFDRTARFYQETLGFKVSDWLGDTVGFFRCANGFHHSLVLVRSPDGETSFDHLCINVESIDDVMRFRHNAVDHGVALRSDLLRHPTSGSISVYIRDEERGLAIEYCTGHAVLDDETHRPRRLPVGAQTADVWRVPLPEPRIASPTGAGDRPAELPSLRS
ncbi:MAG TPA: VOC family protein [Acidimicrobiales bacterium]|nr:VOC family protein [Acidimicrobiales bacterium]